MSFVERNKIWLLPLLGVGVLGVLWMNFKTFKPKPVAPSPPSQPAAPSTSGSANPTPPAPPPAAMPPAPLPPVPTPGAAGADLWSDLRALETPPPELTRTDELLKEGEKPLNLSRLGQPNAPALDPQEWQSLPEPVFPQARTGVLAAKTPTALPKLDFVVESASGAQEAWFHGRPYREGQTPDGVHKIKQIRRWSVVLTGPSGEIRLSTELGRPKAQPSTVPAEAL